MNIVERRELDRISIPNTRRYKFFFWFARQFWIDVCLDITSITVFGLATWQLLTVFSR